MNVKAKPSGLTCPAARRRGPFRARRRASGQGGGGGGGLGGFFQKKKCELGRATTWWNSGVLSLQERDDTKFEDQRQRISRTPTGLTQAVNDWWARENPGRGTYLARY